MTDNRRRHERKFVRANEVRGEFSLTTGNSRYTFTEVEDVSISGLGILLPTKLNLHDKISLSYVDKELRIHIEGVVAWVDDKPCGEDNKFYRVGFQFSREDISSNVMFFMALREYIDLFSEAS